MTDAKLSPRMDAAMRNAQVDDDGELHVGWPLAGQRGTWYGYNTLDALQSRGLINDQHQFTAAGRDWFNRNVRR